jgi:hypothetical protein
VTNHFQNADAWFRRPREPRERHALRRFDALFVPHVLYVGEALTLNRVSFALHAVLDRILHKHRCGQADR